MEALVYQKGGRSMNVPVVFLHGLIMGAGLLAFVWMFWDNKK
jgi:hypothetical protein